MGIWQTIVSATTEVPDFCGSVCGKQPGWPRSASEKLEKNTHSANTECSIFIFQVGLQCKPLKEELLSDHRLLRLVTFYIAIPTEENLPLMNVFLRHCNPALSNLMSLLHLEFYAIKDMLKTSRDCISLSDLHS